MSAKEENISYVKWFPELKREDIDIAGFKGAVLADMYNAGFPVPAGFVLTSQGLEKFLKKDNVLEKVKEIALKTEKGNKGSEKESSEKIRDLVEKLCFPEEMSSEILEAYDILDVDRKNIAGASSAALDILNASHEPGFVAIRGSEKEEESERQKTFLNVKGNRDVLENIKKCLASHLIKKSIYSDKGLEEGLDFSIVIQKMIDSGKSGLIFSKNPKKDGNIAIRAIFGLGNGLSSKEITPDSYLVNPRNDFKILEKKSFDKKIALARNSSGEIESIILDDELRSSLVLSGYQIKMLAQIAADLEEHLKEPQNIQFAIKENEIFIVNSKPIKVEYEEESEAHVESQEDESIQSEEPAKSDIEEKEEEISIEEPEKTENPEITMKPSIPSAATEDVDEEEIILRALEESEREEAEESNALFQQAESKEQRDDEENNDYHPSLEKGKDMPSLNEAIPVSSEHFEENNEEENIPENPEDKSRGENIEKEHLEEEKEENIPDQSDESRERERKEEVLDIF